MAETTPQEALALLDARMAVVMPQLPTASGGASPCMISRSTGPVDGAKYLEGRMAVLSELKRAVRRQPEASLAAVAELIARQWHSDLLLQQERGAARGWVAYRAGGVDELDEILGAGLA